MPSHHAVAGNSIQILYLGGASLFSGVRTARPAHCYDGRVIPSASLALPRPLCTVFLDRDGILNEKAPEDAYIARWEDFRILPDVPGAIARLNRARLRVIVVSNQRGIARGLYTEADVESIHTRFQQLLRTHGARIDAFFICPHDEGQCNCRKPLTGMFDQAVARFPRISPATSVMIGDSAADIEFARRLGMATVFIEGDPALHKPGTAAAGAASPRFTSLAQAVDALLAGR